MRPGLDAGETVRLIAYELIASKRKANVQIKRVALTLAHLERGFLDKYVPVLFL